MYHTTDRIAHTTAIVTPVVETRQYNIHIFGKIILFNYSSTTILSIMISYFCTFDLSCSILVPFYPCLFPFCLERFRASDVTT